MDGAMPVSFLTNSSGTATAASPENSATLGDPTRIWPLVVRHQAATHLIQDAMESVRGRLPLPAPFSTGRCEIA